MGNAELQCDPLPYSLVFGESVLNDAVAIVLFKTFVNFYDSGRKFTGAALPGIMLEFTGVSLGSVIVGILVGLLCSYICKHTMLFKYPEYEVSTLFLFAYGSYGLAESLELSGIMSLFFCAIILSHYNVYNLSRTSQITANLILKSLASLAEFFVFLYVGMGFFTGRYKNWNFLFVFLATIFCLIGRAVNIFPFTWMANLLRRKPITFNMQCEYITLCYCSYSYSMLMCLCIRCASSHLVRGSERRDGLRVVSQHASGAQGHLRDHHAVHRHPDHHSERRTNRVCAGPNAAQDECAGASASSWWWWWWTSRWPNCVSILSVPSRQRSRQHDAASHDDCIRRRRTRQKRKISARS